MKKKVEADFDGIHARLNQLGRTYNPQNENLHFEAVVRADADLYSALLQLAQEGLAKVRQHSAFFSKSGHELYDDDMFWYDLCLSISAAGRRVLNDKVEPPVSSAVVGSLAGALVEISEYATRGNDMSSRIYEALGNTLLAFYSDDLIALARKKGQEVDSQPVRRFVERTISRINVIRQREDKPE